METLRQLSKVSDVRTVIQRTYHVEALLNNEEISHHGSLAYSVC